MLKATRKKYTTEIFVYFCIFQLFELKKKKRKSVSSFLHWCCLFLFFFTLWGGGGETRFSFLCSSFVFVFVLLCLYLVSNQMMFQICLILSFLPCLVFVFVFFPCLRLFSFSSRLRFDCLVLSLVLTKSMRVACK
jgi:hypothetical protein